MAAAAALAIVKKVARIHIFCCHHEILQIGYAMKFKAGRFFTILAWIQAKKDVTFFVKMKMKIK